MSFFCCTFVPDFVFYIRQGMKKILSLVLCAGIIASCAMMMVSCGISKLTPEEKAARKAAEQERVKEAVIGRHFRINVTSMTPLRAETFDLPGGCWIKIDSTMVDCSIPYMGLDDFPHFKTRGEIRMDSKLEFTAETENYIVELDPSGQTILVAFKTEFRGSDYTFQINIDDVNQARIRVVPEDRDEITYEGDLYDTKE